jgi:hypothetical protein
MYMIYLQVDNILTWKNKLDTHGKHYEEFIEPDVENKITAIACLDDGKIFKKLKLN